jgi:hypothetical protein
MSTTIRARIYARGEVNFAKFLFLPSWFAKLLETSFSCFAKIIWMPSWFAKLLELLLVAWKWHRLLSVMGNVVRPWHRNLSDRVFSISKNPGFTPPGSFDLVNSVGMAVLL